MSAMIEIKNAIDKQAEAFEEFKKVNDERIDALKKGDESLAKELDVKLGKIEKDVTAFGELKKSIEQEQQFQRERLEELETRASKPAKTAQEKLKDEYKENFVGWMRNKGMSPIHEQKMQEIQRKDVTIASNAGGGFAVPEEIAREIERLEKKFSPVRNLVTVRQVSTSDFKALVNIRGTTAGWVGESTSRPATETAQLREVTPTHGELYAYPQASEWSLDDIFFNVEQWLAEEVAQEFAIKEGEAVIRGTGSSQPTGMLNTTPTSRDDFDSPIRAAAVYQYVQDNDSPYAIDGDTLLTLIYKLNSMYRANATFVFNSATAGVIRKLKDSQNQYLWAPGLQSGQPDRLLGYPVAIWEQMDDVDVTGGSNATFPVAFGDFRRGYILVDRVGLRITRDNVTNIGFVKFYIRRREGGIVLNNDAIKWLRTAA